MKFKNCFFNVSILVLISFLLLTSGYAGDQGNDSKGLSTDLDAVKDYIDGVDRIGNDTKDADIIPPPPGSVKERNMPVASFGQYDIANYIPYTVDYKEHPFLSAMKDTGAFLWATTAGIGNLANNISGTVVYGALDLLDVVGMGIEAGEDLVVEYTPLDYVDIDAINMFFVMKGATGELAQFARSAKASLQYTKASMPYIKKAVTVNKVKIVKNLKGLGKTKGLVKNSEFMYEENMWSPKYWDERNARDAYRNSSQRINNARKFAKERNGKTYQQNVREMLKKADKKEVSYQRKILDEVITDPKTGEKIKTGKKIKMRQFEFDDGLEYRMKNRPYNAKQSTDIRANKPTQSLEIKIDPNKPDTGIEDVAGKLSKNGQVYPTYDKKVNNKIKIDPEKMDKIMGERLHWPTK
ncbi:MAG: hypothetical protein KKH98_07980 [Spirochaetes bacterium]|nr:hypothetical protein [Spirochaetota bacterium]